MNTPRSLTPEPVCRISDDFRLQEQLLLVLLLVLGLQTDLVRLRLQEHRDELLWVSIRYRSDTSESSFKR